MNKRDVQKSRVSRGWKFLVAIVPLVGSLAMAGTELYVSPAGSDSNPGSQGKPGANHVR